MALDRALIRLGLKRKKSEFGFVAGLNSKRLMEHRRQHGKPH